MWPQLTSEVVTHTIAPVDACSSPILQGPTMYDTLEVIYLSPADQERLPYRIVQHLPQNHIGRKSVGYLYAIHHGAQVRLCTSLRFDAVPNVPLEDLEQGAHREEECRSQSAFRSYEASSKATIWHSKAVT